jgi:hypothetical protein
MKKILVLLSLVSFITWMVSFLTMNYTPIVNIFLLLSILLYIRSVLTVDLPSGGAMTVDGPGFEISQNER